MKLADVNAIPVEDFVATFGDVAEHSSWVAREAERLRPFTSREAMIRAFENAVKAADRDARMHLIRVHPDLATKAKLTDDSTKEQAGAGLDALTPDELERFTTLNTRYRQHFGFPFIFAVKRATKQMILESFEQRIGNDCETEFELALSQVCRILRFRIEDRVLE